MIKIKTTVTTIDKYKRSELLEEYKNLTLEELRLAMLEDTSALEEIIRESTGADDAVLHDIEIIEEEVNERD